MRITAQILSIMRALPLALFSCALLSFAAAAQSRPNIVLIVADDLGYETLGCYGGTSYRTPNLDRLAATGTRFDHAYATPLCTPTRVQLMTGRYAHRDWIGFGLLNPKARTFGHLLRDASYATLMAGKWQFTSYDPVDYPGAAKRRGVGMRAEDAGFDEYSLWHAGHTEDKGSRYADPVIFENGKFREGTRGKYGDDLWTDYVNGFIDRHRRQPFFVYYAMALTHNPFVPTPDSPEWKDPARRHKEETRHFKDMVEYADKLVGKIVGKLDELGLRENTLILFYGDNGTHWRITSRVGGRAARGGKGQMTDAGTRVPLIANWKGTTPAGRISADLVDSTDFLPTLAEAARHELPGEAATNGRSFLPQLRGEKGRPRQWLYLHHDPRPGWDKDHFHLERFARTQRFKLYDDGRLFDLPADLLEEHPILPGADTKTSAAARARLQQVLDAHKPFPIFDPGEVPRENVTLNAVRGHAFQEERDYIVMEAETAPAPLDESWRADNRIPGYAGNGYLLCLRDEARPGRLGVVAFPVKIGAAGKWRLRLHSRSDHPSRDLESECWVRVDDGPWLTLRTGGAGAWNWAEPGGAPESRPAAFDLTEGRHTIRIAPRSRGFKLDRLALFLEGREARALALTTPQSEYHPW